MTVETLIRTGSWNIFSGCGPASLGQKGGMLPLLEVGKGPWIQQTIGEKSLGYYIDYIKILSYLRKKRLSLIKYQLCAR